MDKVKEGVQEPKGHGHHKKKANRINWAGLIGIHRLELQAGSCYGSDRRPSNISYGCVDCCSWGTPNSVSRDCLWIFCLFWGPFSFYLYHSVSICSMCLMVNTRCVLNLNVIYHFMFGWYSWKDFFSEGKQWRKNGSGGEGKWMGETGRKRLGKLQLWCNIRD